MSKSVRELLAEDKAAFDRSVLRFLDLMGWRAPLERVVDWLARRLPPP